MDAIDNASQGREIIYINLFKPEGSSLGFSVVGLKSEHKGELGIYVQEIQPHGIAAQDGQLLEGDQILAIDSQPLDTNISHQQAITILQRAKGTVHLVVARTDPDKDEEDGQAAAGGAKEEMASAASSNPLGMDSDWCQVEVIELINNGSGLGFGIIGSQQPGVIVKTILDGGVADQDGRLQAGDYILQINEHWLQGVGGSEQVASVLRGTGNRVRLVVARGVDPSNPAMVKPNVPILPSSMLGNQKELETHLQIAAATAKQQQQQSPSYGGAFGGPSTNLANDMVLPTTAAQEVVVTHKASKSMDQTTSPLEQPQQVNLPTHASSGDMPEMETLEAKLVKDSQGLGITIAGKHSSKWAWHE